MNGMSMNNTWTRTIPSYVLAIMIKGGTPARTGTLMAVGSMTCVQIGLALSVPLFGRLGPLGTVWLRLAWAALAGVPVDQVRAAFHYVRPNRTVRPADLLDEAGLAALIEAVPAEAAS